MSWSRCVVRAACAVPFVACGVSVSERASAPDADPGPALAAGRAGESPVPRVADSGESHGAGDLDDSGGLDGDPTAAGEGTSAHVAAYPEWDWLARHQSPDGRWDADGFDAHCTLNKCPDPGEPGYDPGVTGLALLAYLGAGETHQTGTHQDSVRRGLRYLKSVQDSEGCFGPRTSEQFQYNHLWASAAMSEAYGMTRSSLLEDSAQRGIHFIHQSQNPYLAWRHGVRDGGNDTVVTAWAVLALRSGLSADLEVDKTAFRGALAWIDRTTDPATGRVRRDESDAPVATSGTDAPDTATAAALLVRILCHDPSDPDAIQSDPEIRRGTERLLQRLPRWYMEDETIDFTYWHFGSLAMFRIDGAPWKRWMDGLYRAVIDHQRVEEGRCERGSFDAEDPWSRHGGRVYATAMNTLCMETYYRYPRVMSKGRESEAR